MATVTGTNLLAGILATQGVTLSPVLQAALAARLQAAIDAGTDSNVQIAVVLGSNPQLLASVPAGQAATPFLSALVGTTKTDIETGTPPPDATYELTADAASADEGTTATFELTTTNVAEGTKVAYTLSGVDAADVVGGLLTGEATVGADGKATISVALVADAMTEGAETLTVTAGGKTASTIVNDTSVDPTYDLTAGAATVNEGNTATFELTTTNVAAGTKVAYTLSGVDAADVVGGLLTGEATVGADGKATISVTLVADSKTEGAETLTVTAGGKTASTIVNDTSVNPLIPFTTSAQDDLQGTTGNDVFQAEATDSLQSSATNTLSGGDVANGREGVDRVVLTTTSTTAAGTTVNGFQLESIEELEIRAYEQGAGTGGTGTTLGLVNVNGLQKVISTTSTSDITLNNVKNLVALDLTGNGAEGTAVTVNYQVDVTAPAAGQTQSVVLNNFGEAGGGNEGLIAVNGVETFDITTAGSSSRTELAGSTLATVNLSLGQDLELVNLDGAGAASVLDTLTTLTAGAADAGALTADLTGAANAVTVTTGAGADVLTVEGALANTVTTNDGNDTVVVTAGMASQTISTGEGNDTITAADGNDVIDAGAGDDLITTGAGNDNVVAGDGDDVIAVGGNLTSGDTIDGGAGNNTIRADLIANTNQPGDFANVTNVQTLVFTQQTSGILDAASAATGAAAAGVMTYTFEQGIGTFNNTELRNVTNGSTVNVQGSASKIEAVWGGSLTVTHGTDTAADSLTLNITASGDKDGDGVVGDGSVIQPDDERIDTLNVDQAETLTLSFNDADTNRGAGVAPDLDTLSIDQLNAADLTTLVLSGNGNIHIGDGDDGLPTWAGTADGIPDVSINSTVLQTIDSSSTGNIVLSTTTTATAVSVTTLGGNDGIATGAGADTVNVGDGANWVNSGAGNDTVTSGAGSDTVTSGVGDDVVNAGDGNNRVDAGTGNDSVTTGAGADTIIAGLGNDTVVAGDGDDVIFAGDGTAIAQLEGVDNLNGGAGDDTFLFTYSTVAGQEGLTSADTVTGGAGNDTVRILAAAGLPAITLVDDIYNNWTSVEVLDVSARTASVTVNAIANAAAGLSVINASGANNDVVNVGEGFTSSLTVQLGAGNDTLDASSAPASANIRVQAAAANINAADTLLGGQGANDTIALTADSGAAVVNATGFEKIEVVADGANTIDITVTDATVAAGATLTVDATALTDAAANLALNASAETNGQYNVLGGAGADVIVTGAGADTISGGAGKNDIRAGAGADVITTGNGNNTVRGEAGSDTITTGTGNDTVYGGAGADTIKAGAGNNRFRYNELADSNATNTDTIIGFQSTGAVDVIEINSAILTAGALKFAGNAANFGAAQGNTTKGDAFIDYVFQQDTNTLWVDLNNDGTLNADDLQIKLQGVTSIEAGDVAAFTALPDALSITINTVNPGSAVVGSLIVGGDGVSTLTFNGTNDISANGLVSIENAVFAAGSNNTMTAEQYNAFTNKSSEAFTNSITLNTAGALGVLLDDVVNYALTGGSSATVNAAQRNVNISSTAAGNTAITLDTAGDSIATYALAGANDSLTVATGRSLVGINAGAATTAETLNLTGAVTMTGAQHVFTTVNAAGAADQVTFTTAYAGNAAAAVEAYVLADLAGNNITLTAAGQDVTGSATNADTVSGGSFVTVNSILNGGASALDVLNLIDDTASNDLNNVTGFETINIANTNASSYTTVNGLVAAGTVLTVVQTGNQSLVWNGALETDGSFNITTSGGNDFIWLGTNGAAGDTVVSGGGDDTIMGGGNVTNADSLNGGLGNDTLLIIGNATMTDNARLVDIENVSIYDTGGADTIDFTGLTPGVTGQTEGINFTLDEGGSSADTYILGNGNDTLTGGETAESSDGHTINGGLGTDVYVINATQNSFLGAGPADAQFLNFEVIRFDAAGMANLGLQSENFTVQGSTGDDTVFLGTGVYNLTAGDGDDIVYGYATVTSADTLTGGNGSDQLRLTEDNGLTDDDLDNVSGFEFINIVNTNASAYTTLDTLVAAGATLTVTQTGGLDLTFDGSAESNGAFVFSTSGGADALTGGAGNDVFDSGTGNDSLVGGAGDDVFTFNTAGDIDLNDVVNGGIGSDTLNVTDGTLVATDLNGVTNVETINLNITGGALTAVNALATSTTALNVTATAAFALSLAAETNAKYNVDLTNSTGVDTVTLGAAHTVGNLATTLVTLTGLGVGDVVDLAGNGAATVLLDLAGSFNAVTFAADVNAALFALGGAYAPAIGTVFLARFGGASSTDIYAVVDVTFNNVTADDGIVHLVGTTASLDGGLFA